MLIATDTAWSALAAMRGGWSFLLGVLLLVASLLGLSGWMRWRRLQAANAALLALAAAGVVVVSAGEFKVRHQVARLGGENDELAAQAFASLREKMPLRRIMGVINAPSGSPNTRFYMALILCERKGSGALEPLGAAPPFQRPRFLQPTSLNSIASEIQFPASGAEIAKKWISASATQPK
jgi:hypothetical protein